MAQVETASADTKRLMPDQSVSELSEASRLSVSGDFLLKILAVIGVLLLVYVLIYLGTWLAMLN